MRSLLSHCRILDRTRSFHLLHRRGIEDGGYIYLYSGVKSRLHVMALLNNRLLNRFMIADVNRYR